MTRQIKVTLETNDDDYSCVTGSFVIDLPDVSSIGLGSIKANMQQFIDGIAANIKYEKQKKLLLEDDEALRQWLAHRFGPDQIGYVTKFKFNYFPVVRAEVYRTISNSQEISYLWDGNKKRPVYMKASICVFWNWRNDGRENAAKLWTRFRRKFKYTCLDRLHY